MSSHPTLSVVIPSYNYGRYLGDCLQSIFGQTDAPPFEVVVVDDGSTDHTAEVLRRWAEPRLRVIRHRTNRGHAAAINTGLAEARGAIVSRIDPDDRYRPHFMSMAVGALDAHPEAALVYGRAAVIDADGNLTGSVTEEPHAGTFIGTELVPLLHKNFICAPTVAARREAWRAVPSVPEHLAFHDWYFTLMIARVSPFCFVDDVVAEYRVHESNHHSRIARDGSEERSVLWLLDEVMSSREADADIEASKQRDRARIYAAHYLDFADKYFWFNRNREARRCYLAAARRHPACLMRPGVARRLAATLVGRRLYEGVKRVHRAGSGGRHETLPAAED